MGTRVLVVDCPVELQIQRVMQRSALSREQAQAIIAAQASREKRLAKADDVIVNDREPNEILKEVSRLHAIYLKMANGLHL